VSVYLSATPIAHKAWIGDGDHLTELVFKHFINTGSNVVDVGANIGTHSLLAAKLAREGRLFSFEPGNQAFEALQNNLRLNKVTNVVTVFGAVAKESGTTSFYEHLYSNEKNFVLLNGTKPKLGSVVTVPAYRLDSFLSNFAVSEIDFLKIDVEGLELEVLKSLGQFIDNVKTIYFECSIKNYARYKHTPEEVISFLNSKNFQIFVPKASGEFLELKPVEIESGELPKNLIATKYTH